MLKRLKLVLLYGGKSGEHEISLRSAASVLSALDAGKYEIIPIGMDKEGCCYLNEYNALTTYTDALPVKTPHCRRLPSLQVDGHFAVEADVVFPVVHGPLYEDGCLQGLLNLAQIACVGSDVLSSAVGMDKDIARRLACVDEQVLCAAYRTLSWHASPDVRHAFCKTVAEELGWPLFVKPCAMGSSVGIHKVDTLEAFYHAVDDALRYDERIVVESFIQGREIELAVLENENPCKSPRVSLPGEIRVHHPDGFYSYAAKYLDQDCSELIFPASLPDTMVATLQQAAADIFVRLKCKGMARVDFFVNDTTGKVYFNEINTLPGFTSISMYPKLWQVSGLPYKDLLDALIALAMTHYGCKQQLVTSYQ